MQSTVAFSRVREAFILRLGDVNLGNKVSVSVGIYCVTSTPTNVLFLVVLWVSWAFLAWPAWLGLIGLRWPHSRV